MMEDNKIFSFISRVTNMIILNVLTIVCCIPIITIGPAVTALYYMTLKMVRGEETYIVRGYFHSFRQNLRQGIIINLIMLVIGAILAFDTYFMHKMDETGSFYHIMYYFTLGVDLIYAILFIYLYPVLAKFYNSIRNTFKNAGLMAIRHFPYTVVMILICALPLEVFLLIPSIWSWVILFFILIGFCLIAYLNSKILVGIFDKYIIKEEESESEPEEKEIDVSVFKNLSPTAAPLPDDDAASQETEQTYIPPFVTPGSGITPDDQE